MVITNGFTYIAFLMCLAGCLLLLEKYSKWRIFNVVPALVFIYVLNMAFCTMGLFDSEACSKAYSVLKNNLLYAMIFVMLLRCDFRKLAKLGGRMVAIFLACSLTLFIGFVVGYPIFKNFLGADVWGAVAALYASWVGGSANMAAMQAALPVDAGAYSCALALDTVCYSVWIALLLLMVRYSSKWDNATKADTSKLQEIADIAAKEVAKEKRTASAADWVFLIGLSLMVSALSQLVGAYLQNAFASVVDLLTAPMWIVYGLFILVIHVVLMFVLSKIFHWDLCMVSTASLANIGGSASAPIVASAYNPSYAGIGVLMGVLGAAVGNFFGIGIGQILKMMS